LSKIVTSNVNDEFKRITANSDLINRGYAHYNQGGSLMTSSLTEKRELPQNVQRKMSKGAVANVRMTSPNFYHPLFESTNIMLPRDRRERNEWCRHFYRTEPIIATAIDLHTEFPISDFNIVCEDPYISKFFNFMIFDKINIHELLLDIGLEYWKIGDVFPYGQLNEAEGMWERFICYNPDYINIQTSTLVNDPIVELIPDAQIQAIVQGGPNGEYGDIYRQLTPDIISSVSRGQNIKLDNRLVSHIAHKASPYEIWGTPIMMRCFKTLIYKDKLRSAQDAIANRHIMPLRVAKIGQAGEPYPSQDDIDDFRDMLYEADGDPSFFLVYHYGLQFEYVGSSGHILPLNSEFDFIQKELMNGLCINEAMLNGDGPTYANAEVGFNTLAKRYMSYRLRLENWIKYKVLKPISEIQGFYTSKNGEIQSKYMSEKQRKISAARKDMELVIPEIQWQQEDLTSNQNMISFIQNLRDKGLISATTILPMVGLDPEIEKVNLENEKNTVFDSAAEMSPPGGNETPETEEPKEEPKEKPVEIEKPIDSVDTIPKESSRKDFFVEGEAIPSPVIKKK
jgi:hypothetical protein